MKEKKHTDEHFESELQYLREELVKMSDLVKENVKNSVKSLVDRDSSLAKKVIDLDHTINRMEVEVHELCIRILALRQPTAKDLRFITTGMKIVTDMERIGDLAVNIAERAMELNEEPQLKPYVDIPRMVDASTRMLEQSIEAFIKEDSELARKVCKDDQLVDDLNIQIFRELLSFMIEDPKTTSRGIRISFISKYLERIADHSTNIAEMVIYMIKGKDVRHMRSRLKDGV
ncbi:PhoU family transcriptional regulator [candidate division WOR-1 bacterium DG_54_3]|uniref:Phosphate-specific transport system accessory protein PhoU n=1 Tax=candidate division WOR-1 bacterium DG_54_3 TaxID=1703775 RepID=A0A0S7XW89_UNCSA|nr:MAG: PhoU family transcriptional regulator [candidate division WOR-1 bacterium DG_54_3]